jgi:hypothetical protein
MGGCKFRAWVIERVRATDRANIWSIFNVMEFRCHFGYAPISLFGIMMFGKKRSLLFLSRRFVFRLNPSVELRIQNPAILDKRRKDYRISNELEHHVGGEDETALVIMMCED